MRKPSWMTKKGVTKRGFAVGLRTRRATTLLVLERRRPPLRGPFTLEAVVSERPGSCARDLTQSRGGAEGPPAPPRPRVPSF